MTQDRMKVWVLAGLATLVLMAFVYLFATELWHASVVGAQQLSDAERAAAAAKDVSDPRTYVMTGIATLVGGVAAVFLGVKAKDQTALLAEPPTDYIRLAYVVVYLVFGALALFAWIRLGDATSLPVKNLAVTFFGLLGPAVGGYLNPPS